MNYIEKAIENEILTNDYYEKIKTLYDKADDKDYVVYIIYQAYCDFDAEHSIYTIMDSIEEMLDEDDLTITALEYTRENLEITD